MRHRLRLRKQTLVAALLVAGAACSDDEAPSPPSIQAELGGTSMADTPWPSDVFLQNGKLHVESIPGLEGQKEPLDALAATLSEMDGASIYGSAFFPVSGTVVDGAVDGKATWTDLDDGHAFDTDLWMRAQTSELVALAPKDTILTAGHRYSVVVRSPRITPSAKMKEALAANGATDASAITVFTVGRPTAMVDRMHDVSAARPAPAAKVTKVLRGADLDDFAGAPTTTRPGLGDPKGIVHDELDAVILGTFDAPSFLSDAPPQLGRIDVDASGAPIVKGTEAIPFLLTLPKKPAAGWGKLPIVIFQHGLNAGRAQVMSCANDYARAGYATIGVDALWHGDRAPKKKDEVHNFSGAPGPDGLADADDFGASVNLFDFGGDDARAIGKFDGRYVRDNFRQAIADLVELARFLRYGDLSAVAAADASFAGLAFDGEHVVYTSESFGSVIGTSVIAVSPDLAGAVLSVAGGGIFLPMFPNSPTFNGILTPFLKTSFDPYIDLSDPKVLPGAAMRSLSLLETVITPGDALAFAPLIAERKRNVLVLQARSDELIPNQATELMMKAMGATSVTLPAKSEPPRFVTLPMANAPYQGNGNTLAVTQLSPALHTVFTSFTGERRYEPDFPPFVSKDPPETVDNPIELAHALAIAFADSIRAGGAGKVGAP